MSIKLINTNRLPYSHILWQNCKCPTWTIGDYMRKFFLLISAVVLYITIGYAQQDDMSDVQIEVTQLTDNIYALFGAGGNIGLSVGEDGAFLIDDQFAPLSEKITEAVAAVTDKPISFLLNTHYHFDHTGGNENFSNSGVMIVAHKNVYERMSTEQVISFFDKTIPPSPEAALPVITFTDEMTFHWNDDDINIFHADVAHTDGDSIVYFPKANVVHMGDLFFNGMYPFIDLDSKGSMVGMIAGVARVLELIDEDTQVIPGHGPMGTKDDLQTYHDMLITIHDKVQTQINRGKSKESIIAAELTKDFDTAWGNGILQSDQWIELIYESIIQQ